MQAKNNSGPINDWHFGQACGLSFSLFSTTKRSPLYSVYYNDSARLLSKEKQTMSQFCQLQRMVNVISILSLSLSSERQAVVLSFLPLLSAA